MGVHVGGSDDVRKYCMRVLRKMSGEGDEPRGETNGSVEMDTTEGGGELTLGWRDFGSMKGRVALNFCACTRGRCLTLSHSNPNYVVPPGEDNEAGPNTDSQLDLNTVQDALQSAAQKWYTLGLQLGLSSPVLHAVESETGKELSYYLSEMLKSWVEREDPRPSWRALIEALKKNDETELANRLQEQYGKLYHSLALGGAHKLHMLTRRLL